MAWTWEEILTDSLSLSGILGQGQVVNAAMLADAKRRASALLDELDGDGIALPVFSIDVDFVAEANRFRYVLGEGTETPDNPIRPETILTGRVEISGGANPVYQGMTPMAFTTYRKIPVPSTTSQPFNYSLNPKWPQAELYLYPSPAQDYPISLVCKVKWIDVVTDPVTNTFSYAQLPSGYTNAFVNVLAYRLAQWRRLSTPDLEAKARRGKYVMTTYTFVQVPDLETEQPSPFSWNILQSGVNP